MTAGGCSDPLVKFGLVERLSTRGDVVRRRRGEKVDRLERDHVCLARHLVGDDGVSVSVIHQLEAGSCRLTTGKSSTRGL